MSFIPEVWSKPLLEQLVRHINNPFGIDPDNLPNTYTESPRTPEWLANRTEFAARFTAIVEEGLAADYLDYDHCYECGGQLQITTDTSYTIATPNPDFIPPETITPGTPITFRTFPKGTR